jgi:hypothetical protein
MANATENAPNYTIPALPPFPAVAPLVHAPPADDGQIWPLGSTVTAVGQALTPQYPRHIILPATSAISSVTNPTVMNASSPGDPNKADDTPIKGSGPKCKFSDFSRAFSHDNALLSGDKSDGWGDELEDIQQQIAAAKNLERDDAYNMEDSVDKVQEFEYILEEEEGNADEATVYDSITVTKKTHTVAGLKDICKALDLSTGGKKAAIFTRIQDFESSLIVPIDDKSFEFKKIRGGEADLSLPRCEVDKLSPADAGC